MLSLHKYKYTEGNITAVLNQDFKLELLHNKYPVDSCNGKNNYSLINISVGYSDVDCEIRGSKAEKLMYIHTGIYSGNYKLKDVLSALVKMNNTPVTESANIKEFDY